MSRSFLLSFVWMRFWRCLEESCWFGVFFVVCLVWFGLVLEVYIYSKFMGDIKI